MTKKTINYEPLREWQRITGNRGEYMAEIAGINPSTLSRWITAGKAVPGEVILAWQTAFRWSVGKAHLPEWSGAGGRTTVCDTGRIQKGFKR